MVPGPSRREGTTPDVRLGRRIEACSVPDPGAGEGHGAGEPPSGDPDRRRRKRCGCEQPFAAEAMDQADYGSDRAPGGRAVFFFPDAVDDHMLDRAPVV